jgi:hypothetical protein
VLRHQIQDLVAVADLTVQLCLQVLQVLLVPKALQALHFVFWHCIILGLISPFRKWHKLWLSSLRILLHLLAPLTLLHELQILLMVPIHQNSPLSCHRSICTSRNVHKIFRLMTRRFSTSGRIFME